MKKHLKFLKLGVDSSEISEELKRKDAQNLKLFSSSAKLPANRKYLINFSNKFYHFEAFAKLPINFHFPSNHHISLHSEIEILR